EKAWAPAKRDLARARAALAAAWDRDESPQLDGSRNRWTVRGHGLQLRLGRDGRWYPYREESGAWWPAGPPHRDPAAVLAELLGG
ncbi:MAG: SWIM zinc finger family protein, partial [Actinomadura sp.]